MSGVYGEMLGIFPELMEDYEVFSMKPLVKGGWSERTPLKTVSAYISMTKPAKLGYEDGNTESNHAGTMWVEHDFGDEHLPQGSYVEYHGDVYKIIDDDPYIVEGGFCEYRLQIVAGTDGTQKPVPEVEKRIVDDY